METVFAVLHVVGAVFVVGPMAILPMTAMRALRSGNGAQVRSLSRATFIFSLVSIAVLIFGFGLLGMSDPKYNLSVTTPWILISLIAYLIALALNLALVVPAMRKAGRGLESAEGTPSGAAYPRIAITSGISALLLLLVVVLMVVKP